MIDIVKSVEKNRQFNEEDIKKIVIEEFIASFNKLNKFQKVILRNFFQANKNEFLKIKVKNKIISVLLKDEVIKEEKINFDFDFEIEILCNELYELIKNKK
jgi:hypothetical protein